MTGPLDPRTARRRFASVTFLLWLPAGLCLPTMVLLMGERGMGLSAVAGLFAVHSLTVAALELPTGGLSDAIGRRAVLAFAGVLSVAAMLLLALGTTLWALVLAMVLMGSGRALSSGPAEAWYVDTVQARSGSDAELRTGLARGNTASAAALALGTLCGGGLPWLLDLAPLPSAWTASIASGPVLPLSIPPLVGAVVGLVHTVYVLTALPEPPRAPTTVRGVLRGVPATMLDGLRLGTRNLLVRRVLSSTAAMGTALAAIELLAPGRSAELTGAPESGALLFASLACAGFVCTALGSHAAPAVARLTGSGERAILVALGVSVTGLLLLGVTVLWSGPSALGLAAAGYALVYLGLGSSGPNQNTLLHRNVDSTGRATALSVQSLAQQLAGALAGLVIGALPSGPLPWLLAGAVLLAGALPWARGGRRDSAASGGRPLRQPEAEPSEPSGPSEADDKVGGPGPAQSIP